MALHLYNLSCQCRSISTPKSLIPSSHHPRRKTISLQIQILLTQSDLVTTVFDVSEPNITRIHFIYTLVIIDMKCCPTTFYPLQYRFQMLYEYCKSEADRMDIITEIYTLVFQLEISQNSIIEFLLLLCMFHLRAEYSIVDFMF